MLTIDSLDTYYSKSHVLRNVSLTVDAGKVMAILGRNGAGKTTLIRSIMGVKAVRTTGGISFDGTDLTGLDPEDRANLGIGWVPESRRIFPNITVEENLRMGQIHAASHDMTLEGMYEFFPKLGERRTQSGGTLSGGEQQMLAIARALLTDPDLLLVDEPFEGLMPSLVRDIEEILNRLVDQGYSLLLVEQKPEETLGLADTAAILETGEIVYDGRPDRLLDDDELLRTHIGVVK